MGNILRLENAPVSLRNWVESVYHGIEDYFPLPTEVDLAHVRDIAFWKAYDLERRRLEVVWSEKVWQVFRSTREEVAQTFADSHSLSHTLSAFQRFFPARLNRVLRDLYYEVERHFLGRLKNQFSYKASDEWEVLDPYDIPDMQDWNAEVLASKIKGIDAATMRMIRRHIEDGLDHGSSIDTIRRRLTDSFGFSKQRAEVITRTEVISTSNAATHFGILKATADNEMTKDWWNSGDRRVRPSHVRANSQKDVPVEQPFVVGLSRSEMLFPGDGSLGASAAEVIQCRCICKYHLPRRLAPAPPAPQPSPEPKPLPPLPKPRVPRKPPVPRVPKPKPAPVTVVEPPATPPPPKRVPLQLEDIAKTVRISSAVDAVELASHKEYLLDGISRLDGVDNFLKKNKLTVLEINPNKKGQPSTGGMYYYIRHASQSSRKSIDVFWEGVKRYKTGNFKPTEDWLVRGPNFRSNLQRTSLHEFAHHLHLAPGRAEAPAIDGIVKNAFAKKRQAISRYGDTNRDEYFAESVVAFVYHNDTLASVDPIGHAMVTSVFKILGLRLAP